MRSLVRALAGVSLLVVAIVASAEPNATKRDRQGPVTVALTPLSALAAGAPLKFKIQLDTHSGSLDDVALERAVLIRTADGKEIAPTGVEQAKGGGHHRDAVVVFGPAHGREVHVVVKDVGGVAERSFVWPLAAGR